MRSQTQEAWYCISGRRQHGTCRTAARQGLQAHSASAALST